MPLEAPFWSITQGVFDFGRAGGRTYSVYFPLTLRLIYPDTPVYIHYVIGEGVGGLGVVTHQAIDTGQQHI